MLRLHSGLVMLPVGDLKYSVEGAGESGGCQEEGVLKEEGEEGLCWGTGDQSDPSEIRLRGDSMFAVGITCSCSMCF